MDSGKTRQRMGKLPLVLGMPVMITHNFDVASGIVNGCVGTLKSIRYQLGKSGKRHAISCVVSSPSDTATTVPLPHLNNSEFVALKDTVELSFHH
ncbi:hypothetical protein K435DRAFT_671219, partial [Dendrothele bispora CBS 962.96]